MAITQTWNGIGNSSIPYPSTIGIGGLGQWQPQTQVWTQYPDSRTFSVEKHDYIVINMDGVTDEGFVFERQGQRVKLTKQELAVRLGLEW